MSTREMQRGYDDTGYLSEMAAGLVSRRFTSVDEAARAVLDDEAGSNVDRLRRKFREQGWYEKGLAAHVDAVILSRHLIVEPGYHAIARRFLAHLRAPVNSIRKVASAAGPMKRLRADSRMMAISLVSTALLAAAAADMMTIGSALMLAVTAFTFILFSWADMTSELADGRTAAAHLGAMGVGLATAVASFGHASPNSAFLLGSSEGTVAIAIGLTAMGVYTTSFIGGRARRSGTRGTFEVGCLIAAISALSQVGTALLVYDGVSRASLPLVAALAH